MAESSNRDINLRIRAKDYSKKTLQDLQKSIGALTKAQEDQQKAAQKGETSSRSLEKSYQDLEKATKAAVRQVADVKAYENQTKALDGARTATSAAQDAFQKYERTLKNTPKVTAEQTKELNSLRKEMVAAEKDEQRQASRLDALSQRLKAYGIATNDIQGALSKLEQVVNKANGSLEKQEKAFGINEAALKRLKKAEEDAAKQTLADAMDRQRKALEGVAKDAISAANGWRSVATSVRSFGDAATPATAAVNGLLGVTGPLGRSIKDVDANMRTMAADLNASTSGISNSKTKIKELADAQRQLSKAAGLVDTFRQQMQTLRQSREEYSAAQKNVRDLASQLKNAGDGAKDIQSKLSMAQTALGRSAKSFRDNADAAQQTRAQLNQLGVTTKTIADAENQLVGTTNQVTAAQRAMNDAIGRGVASSMNDQAAAMTRAASEARSMAVGMNNVAASTTPVSDAIRNIVAPANQANNTLKKMEDNASLLANSFSTIRRPVEDAANKMRMLASAQEAIKGTAGLIDTFNMQKKSLQEARVEYKNAQQEIGKLTQAARAGGISESELAVKVDQATQKVRASAAALREQATNAKATREQLRSAGIDTNNLTGAEERLSQAAHNAASAENSLTQAVEKYGKASKQAFGDTRNSALSVEGVITKLKNEIIGLTAAYTGLQGAMTLTNNVVDASIRRQQFMSQSALAVGNDVSKQTEQWEYIGKLSEKWGLDMAATSKDYSRFLVSVTKSGGTVDDAKSMFEDLAIIGRANNLTGDEFHRMIYAFDQMLSQGQIMTSELKLQLGNVLPGAYEMAAIKLNGTTQGFREKLQEGFYRMNAIFALAKDWGKDSIDAATKAADGIIGAQNRMKNATNEFNLRIADSGFIDSYTQVLKKATELLRSEDGAEFARKIGGAMTTAADAALWLAKHIDAVIAVLKVLAGLMAAKVIIGFAGTVRGMYLALLSFRTAAFEAAAGVSAMERSLVGARYATTALTWGMKALGWAVPFIGWALLILDFVTAVYQASSTFRDFCWNVMAFWKTVINYFYNMLTGASKSFSETLRDSTNELDQYRSDEDKKRLGIKSAVENITTGTEVIDGVTYAVGSGTISSGGRTAKTNQTTQQKVAGGADMTPEESARLTKETSITFDEMDQRRERFIKEYASDNKKLDRETRSQQRKSYKEDLEERLSMVREEYSAKLQEGEALDKSGKTQDSRLKAEQTMNRALALERTKFWNEVGKIEADKAQQRAEKIKGIEATIQQNRDTIESTASQSGWNESNYGEREAQYIDAQVGKYKDLEAQIRRVGGAEAERLNAQLEGLKQTTAENARQAFQLAEIERYNKQIKNLEDERNAQLSVLKTQKDNYQLSDSEYIDKVNSVYNQSKQGLLEATAAAEKFGEANRNAFKTDAEYAQWKAQLASFRIETENSGNQLAEYQKQAATGLAQSINTGFSALVENITAVTQGTQTWGEAFQNTAVAMLQYFAQLLQQIAMTIIEAAIMNALLGGAPAASGAVTGAGAGLSSAATASSAASSNGSAIMAGKNHNGGMAGSSGIGRKSVPAMAFANAQRYHTGGMIGLQPDEVPIIAQKGEEMLTRDDPRNRLNGGASGESSGSTRIIAVDDHRSALTEAMKTPEGEKAVITVLRRNLSTVKKMTR